MTKELISVFLLLLLADSSHGIRVSIQTDPPSAPYPAATWIWFACDVREFVGAMHYNWTTHCTRRSPQYLGILRDHGHPGEFFFRVRSTPSSCLDAVKCSASDSTGQTAVATWQAGTVTGVGLFGVRHPLLNNSALTANSRGDIGTIFCHSSTYNSNVGRWISPTGRDITFNHNDNFVIGFNNGPYYPSYSTLELYNPLSTSFSTADQGAYSCVVPDSNGVMQTLSIWIYPHGYQGELSVNSVGSISTNPLTINCGTTGLPPTLAIWKRSGIKLSNGGTYQMTQRLKNRATCDYDNILTINQPINEAKGVYHCEITHAEYDPEDNSHANILTEQYAIALYGLGSRDTVSCALSNVSYSKYYNQNGQLLSNPFELYANDSVHGQVFYCRGFRRRSSTESVFIRQVPLKVAVIVQDSVLAAIANPLTNDNEPVIGQQYGMSCRAVKTSGGLMNSPRPQWTDRNGSPVVEGRGISLTESPGRVSLSISSLHTSHAGSYHCRATLTSPALDTPLVNVDTFNITVTIPTPMVAVNVSFSSQPELHCEARVSRLIDTPISVQITWKDANTNRTITNSDHVSISNVTHLESHAFRSTIMVSEETSVVAYICEAVVSPRTDTSHSYLLPSNAATSQPVYMNATGISCTRGFEISFGEVKDCKSWRFDNTEGKIQDVITSLVEQIRQQCPECQLVERAITQPQFSCSETDSKIVTFHANIMGYLTNCNTTLKAITKWSQSGEATVTILSNRLNIKPTDCSSSESGCNSEGGSEVPWLYVGPGLGTCVLLITVIVIVVSVVLCITCHTKRRKKTPAPDSDIYSYPALTEPGVPVFPMIKVSNFRPPLPPPRPALNQQYVNNTFNRTQTGTIHSRGEDKNLSVNGAANNEQSQHTSLNVRSSESGRRLSNCSDTSSTYIDIIPNIRQPHKNTTSMDNRYEDMDGVARRLQRHCYVNVNVVRNMAAEKVY